MGIVHQAWDVDRDPHNAQKNEEREVGRESWVMEASDATWQRPNVYQGGTSGSGHFLELC